MDLHLGEDQALAFAVLAVVDFVLVFVVDSFRDLVGFVDLVAPVGSEDLVGSEDHLVGFVGFVDFFVPADSFAAACWYSRGDHYPYVCGYFFLTILR